jgi:hypothetical protein
VDQPRRKQTTLRPIPTPKTYPYCQTRPYHFRFDQLLQVQARHRSTARELYTGHLFQKAVAWAEQHRYRWFIISALHGLVTADQTLQPYNFTIKELRKPERESWAYRAISCQLSKYAPSGSHAFLIMPEPYRRHIQTTLRERGITYENPVEGMGIGQQMKWLTNQ